MGIRKRTKVPGAVDIEAIGKRASVVAYALMLMAIGVIFTLSWNGLTRFGEKVLGLQGWSVHILPGSLDGAVIMFGCMAIVSMISGENASVLRLLVQVCALTSAVFNGYQGWISVHGDYRYFAGVYFAGLSLLVAMISHWFFRRVQRAARIESGTLSVETVHFSLTEWTKFPYRRWKARTLALEYGIANPRLAITLEASVNGRINPDIMRAIEAFRDDEATAVYEFFPRPEPDGNGSGKRRKSETAKTTPEAVAGTSPEAISPVVRPELTTGTATGTATGASFSADVVQGLNGANDEMSTEETDVVDPAIVADNILPERPEPEPGNGKRPGQPACVGFSDACQCRHRNAVSFFGSHSEAVEYAIKETGNDTGTDLTRWLNNHGRKVGQSTVYDALKRLPKTGTVVPFRSGS